MAIGPVIRFLQAARSMAKQGMKKEQILDFARREFGKVSELLKKQIDDIYSRYKKPAKTGEKGEVIPFKKKETKDIVKKRTDDIIKERTEDMQPTGELMKDIENRIEDIKKINVKKYNPFDDFLGPSKPLNKREGIVRTAAREILEKNKIKIGSEDPIDVLRKTYGEAGLEAVDNIGDTLLDAQSYGEIKNILTKNKLFDLKPKKVPGYDQSVIVGEKIRKQLETEAKHKKILEDFDPDRIPNASGGIAGQLHLNQGGEVMPEHLTKVETNILKDKGFWIRHHGEILDARIGGMEAKKEGGREITQDDKLYLFKHYKELEKSGGDPTNYINDKGDLINFKERIENLKTPIPEKTPVPDSRSAKRPKWWYDPEELDPFEKKPWDEEEEEEEETSRGLSNILRV